MKIRATDEMKQAVRYWGLDPWATHTGAYDGIETPAHPNWWSDDHLTPMVPLDTAAGRTVVLRTLAWRWKIGPDARFWRTPDGFWNLGDGGRTVAFGELAAGTASDWTWDGVKYVNTGEWLPENEIQALCVLLQVNNPTT